MQLYVLSLIILAAGSLFSLFASGKHRQWPGALTAITGAALACSASIMGFCGYQGTTDLVLRWNIPTALFHLGWDPLTGFFVLVIALICGLAALYGWGYLKHQEHNNGTGRYWFFYNLLFASLLLVVAARNGMLFLIAWEIMSLSSFFLVVYEYEKKEVIKAGFSYLVATHIGTAFLLILFILLGKDGNMEFSNFKVTGDIAVLAFILGIIGFGTKAGIMPLHTWLPEAHPAAPSPVSAVMSGVMIKAGIYGILRLITFTASIPAWWGWALLALGALSGIVGVLYANGQHDLKKLLAYCSVENIGIILLGLSLGLLGISYQLPLVAILGFGGGLLHILNHALFKSLLFFGAGSVLKATGGKNIEQWGGIGKRMPYTAFFFLVGAIGICGLPPLNGFISEFLIYLAAFSVLPGASGWVGAVISIGSLCLIGVLAAFCFTKVFGITFLGEPRSTVAANAKESNAGMLFPMLLLALLCLTVGLAAPLILRWIIPVIGVFYPILYSDTALLDPYLTIMTKISLISLLFFALLLVIAGARKLLQRKRTITQGVTWDCGYHAVTPRMQYTASSFAEPLLKLFGRVLGVKKTVNLPAEPFPAHGDLDTHSSDLFLRFIYKPLNRAVRWIAARLFWIKKGNTHRYVLYIAITLIALLIWKVK